MKIIQITTTSVENNRNTQCDWLLHALTDDGRIFEMTNVSGWREMALPQEQQPSLETRPEYDPHDHTNAAYRRGQETESASFGLEINGEAQKVKKCPTCDRDFIGGASDRYCGSDHCVLEPDQG